MDSIGDNLDCKVKLVQYPNQPKLKQWVPLHNLSLLDGTHWYHGTALVIVADNNLSVTILNPYPNFPLFSTIYFALLVTRPSLVPSRAARTVTKSPDKSPDGPPDQSAVNYHMPSLRSPQHHDMSSFNPFRPASS